MRTNTCLVVDVWEGQLEIDEAALKAGGVAGIGIRLNDMNGGHHPDAGFERQWREAAAFVRFPYFVYNPWVSGGRNFAWLQAYMPADAHSVAVDIEVSKYGLSKSTYAAEVADFLGRCKSKWKTIIYTAEWFLPNLSVWPRMDYWWAQYPDSQRYFSGVGSWEQLSEQLDQLDVPFNYNKCPGEIKMWQFSGDALTLPGSGRKIDVNLFYGSESDLAAYFGTGAAGGTNQPGGGSGTGSPPIVNRLGLYAFSPKNFYARPGGGPLTLPMSRQRKLGDNLTRYLWAALKPILTRLNCYNRAAVDKIAAENWGPSKGLDGEDIKWIGLLWPGRNVVKVEEFVDGWARLEGCPLAEAGKLDVYSMPHLVHEVFDFHPKAGYCSRGKRAFVPILGESWWVEADRLLSLNAMLPKVVKVEAIPGLRIRKGGPATTFETSAVIAVGQTLTVIELSLGEKGIWGKVAPDSWIALRYEGLNLTDWII